MNAKELAEICDQIDDIAIECDMGGMKRTAAVLDSISSRLAALIPAYHPPRPEDDGKYCYLEELPSDAPPTLVRCVPHNWVYWTVAGWRDLKLGKGIWPCERPD